VCKRYFEGQRWPDSAYVTALVTDIMAINLTDAQLTMFWSATSPILDRDWREGTELNRSFGAGMRHFAEIFMGTLVLKEEYATQDTRMAEQRVKRRVQKYPGTY